MNIQKIITRDFGQIEIKDEDKIFFPNGLFAFDDSKEFVLLSPMGKNSYPMWLQSTQSEKPCFIVYNPNEIIQNYNVNITSIDKKSVDLEDSDEICYLVIAVVPEDFKKTTVNLKSPIVVNKTKSKAVQIILDNDYSMKYPLFNDKGDE